MDSFLIATGIWVILICAIETAMWCVFYYRTVRICFLTEPDLLFSKYMTIESMRVFAILHTLILVTFVFLMHQFLW